MDPGILQAPILAEEVLLNRTSIREPSPRRPKIDYKREKKLAQLKNIPTMGFFKTSHLVKKPPINEQVVTTREEQD
jgi:hypothetical protein